jgi:shikimate kinase
VDSTRQIRNLTLIGFMGTGKSTVGRAVADILRYTFLDTDDVIEARAGATIQEIFQHHGEPVFREWEHRIVEELTRRNKTVIATGGGLPANETNLTSLKSHSLVVCLWSSPEKIWQRVKSQTHRPLLNDADPLGKIKELLEIRAPYYRQADVLINTEFRSLHEVTRQVIHQFRSAESPPAANEVPRLSG